MSIPEDLRYTTDHEWIRTDGDEGIVGITDFAQDALGGVVFVELPEVGASFDRGAPFGVVESNKAVSDLYAPVAGEVVAINESLADEPERVNDAPYDGGWMIRIKLRSPGELDDLLTAAAYGAHVADEGGA